MQYMKSRTLTVRIDNELNEQLERACAETGRSRGAIVRDALRRQLRLQEFESARALILPFAEAAAVLTDEDVFRLMS